MSAFFGVQTSKAYERDFKGERAWWVYLLVAIIAAAVFVVLLIWIAHALVGK